jgi:ubiquinone/menaquinone biosynthesis C-methylase UbiE
MSGTRTVATRGEDRGRETPAANQEQADIMDTIDVFSAKAATYARYRWDYAAQAIQTILDVTQVSHESVVADIGAGTGILTRHFAGKVKQVLAVEPNQEMRRLAASELGAHPGCRVVEGRAEATTLPDHAVDLITAAQAMHWFEPQPTRIEFARILKPGGWLAVLRNYGTDDVLSAALAEMFPEGNSLDTAPLMKGRGTPLSFYYGGDRYLKQVFPFTTRSTREAFIGSLSTASYAPDKESPLYADFERAANQVFDRLSRDGWLESHAATELYLGHIARP